MSAEIETPTLIQGNLLSFHAEAAVRMGIGRTACLPMDTHKELYEALRARIADDAVVAVTNSSIGRVIGSYEELLAGALLVIDRVDLPIDFGLYAMPGTTTSDIKVVHTQSHAYKQCAGTLARHLPWARWQEEQDTAGSALIVQELGDKTHAAICPKRAGKLALLECIYDSLQDSKDNYTTFYRISNKKGTIPPKDADIAVAILDTEDYVRAAELLSEVVIVRPLYTSDEDNSPLIIELETTDHTQTIQQVQRALTGMGTIRYIGGYIRTPDNDQPTQEQTTRYAIMEPR
jgi:prephenate dehydratase